MTSIPFQGPVTCYLPDVVYSASGHPDCTPHDYGEPLTFAGAITVNLLTIDREARNSKQYLFQTIASVYLGGYQGDINLHVGQGSAEYLSELSHHKKVTIHKHSPDPMQPFANLVHNWLESVRDPTQHHLFLEDDIILADGWYDSLLERIRLLHSMGTEQFILCLPQPSYAGFSGLPVATGSKPDFTGSYGLFFTGKAMQVIHPHVLGEFEHWQQNPKYHITLDMAIKYAMIRSNTRLFHCVPSLATHVGLVCSLTNGGTETPKREELFNSAPVAPSKPKKKLKLSLRRFNENRTN